MYSFHNSDPSKTHIPTERMNWLVKARSISSLFRVFMFFDPIAIPRCAKAVVFGSVVF